MLKLRKWLALALVLLLVATLALPASLAESPEDYDRTQPQLLTPANLYAHAAVLMDGVTGRVMLRKNANERMYPASTTKIMTLMIALESGISLDTPVIIPREAANIAKDSTLVPVFPGDQMSFGDLLYGFMLTSGNDGANAVAVLVGGSIENFVARMNRRAEELGCTRTHFVNPHGYHNEDHYTCAEDLAIITREALKLDQFREIVSCPSYTMTILRDGETINPKRTSTNLLLTSDSGYYYADCIGVKTGTHSAAGNCFVGAAERDGIQMISVVLNCPESNQKWVDTIRLFDYGYSRYVAYTMEDMFAAARNRIATIKISNAIESDPQGGALELNIARLSNQDYSRMISLDSDTALEEALEDFVSRAMITITHSMVAPISEGEIMGQFRYVSTSGEEITALLVAGRSIEAQPPKLSLADFFPFLNQLKDPLVLALIAVLACLIVLLIVAAIVHSVNKQRRRREIYEVRRRQKLRQDREREHARMLECRRSRSYDDYDDDDSEYDVYDAYDDEGDDPYDAYDDEDGDGEFDAYDAYDEGEAADFELSDREDVGARKSSKRKRSR